MFISLSLLVLIVCKLIGILTSIAVSYQHYSCNARGCLARFFSYLVSFYPGRSEISTFYVIEENYHIKADVTH